MWSKQRENGYERSSNVGGDTSCSYQSTSSEDDDSENEMGHNTIRIEPRKNNIPVRDKLHSRLSGLSRNSTSSNEAPHFQARQVKPSPKSNRNRIASKRKCNDEDEFEQSDYKISGRQKCHSRNAIMARENRIKKKLYLESLENKISKLSEENNTLRCSVEMQAANVTLFKDRVRYLEGVLANSPELGMLLNSVKNNTGLPTINSLRQNTGKPQALGFPPPQPDHIYSKTPDVLSNCTISPAGEDNPRFVSNSFLAEDSAGPLISGDISLPYLLSSEEDLPLPKSDYSFDLDYNNFNRPFEFELLDNNSHLGDNGICLHIAKKRVSIEFCSSCNINSASAWDKNILATGI